MKKKKYTDKQLEHFFQKWLDTYDDWYGPIDEYSDQVCPCVLCFDQSPEPNPNADYIFVFEDDDDEDDEDIRDESNYLGFDDGGEG